MKRSVWLAVAAVMGLSAPAARAADCGKTAAGFDPWLEGLKAQAIADGVSPRVVKAALDGVEYDDEVIRLDRTQKPFKVSFKKFVALRLTPGRVALGRAMLVRHDKTLAEIKKAFGVPPEILVAIWGLETDYGTHTGQRPVFRSLATLAYDCRRATRFRGELMSALRIVERGDMNPADMVGAWAGELGQTQFLASSYERYAIDFDEDGRRDLMHSAADVLGSTAHYLFAHDWRADNGWQEGSANFDVLASWNQSKNYQKTIALFASRLAERR